MKIINKQYESKIDNRLSAILVFAIIWDTINNSIYSCFNYNNEKIFLTVYYFNYLVFMGFILFNIKYILNRIKLKDIFLIGFFIFVYLSNFLVFNANRSILISLFRMLFIKLIPTFIIVRLIRNREILYKSLKISANIQMFIFLFTLIFGTADLTGKYSWGYNMSWGYDMVFPLLIFLTSLTIRFKITEIIYCTVLGGYILLYGPRGAIIPIVVFLVLYILKRSISFDIKYQIYGILLSFVLCVISMNFYEILKYIETFLYRLGINSRTLSKLIDGTLLTTSGRDVIENNMLKAISQKNTFGWGIGGDRYYNAMNNIYQNNAKMDGAYAHNIILEMLVQFGVIVGTIIIIIIFYLSIKSIIVKNDRKMDSIVIIMFSIGVVPLFTSMSYLTHLYFWIMIGIASNKYLIKTD